jgi:hypothetical protein
VGPSNIVYRGLSIEEISPSESGVKSASCDFFKVWSNTRNRKDKVSLAINEFSQKIEMFEQCPDHLNFRQDMRKKDNVRTKVKWISQSRKEILSSY